MRDGSDQNTEFLSARRAEAELERRLRDAMRDIWGADVQNRTVRRIIAYGEVKPAGKLPNRLTAMRRARKPLADAERLVEVIREWVVNDLYGEASEAKRVG